MKEIPSQVVVPESSVGGAGVSDQAVVTWEGNASKITLRQKPPSDWLNFVP